MNQTAESVHYSSHSNQSSFTQQMLSCLLSDNSTTGGGQPNGTSCLLSILMSGGDYYHSVYPIRHEPPPPNDLFTFDNSSTATTSEIDAPNALVIIRDVVRFWVQRILVPIVTVVGLFGNLLTMVVMCQRRMSTSSTHIYLAALALSDALYLGFVFLLSLVHYPAIQSDLTTAKWIYWHSYPAFIFGCDFASNTSIWLTVCFTIERYIVIRYPIKGKVLCTTSRAIKVIFLVALICFLITLPTFFEWKIVTSEANSTSSVQVKNTELGLNPTYRSIYYWATVLGFVFIPLTILTIFNLFLIRSVRKSSQKRRQWIADQQSSGSFHSSAAVASSPATISGSCLVHTSAPQHEPYPSSAPKSRSLIRFGLSSSSSSTKSKPPPIIATTPTPTYRYILRQDAHITRMLIAVVLFFLICQLPSALVIIYTASIGSHQSANQQLILHTLGNLFNLLVAINSAGNFALYCLLSRKYRRTLLDLIRKLSSKFKN